MILLILLFFCTPLIFSHILSVFGISVILSSGYERYKVYLTIILVGILAGLFTIQERKNLFTYFQKKVLILGLIGIYALIWLFLEHQTFLDILMGSPEKQHGMLFFWALAGLFILLDGQYSGESRKYIAQWSIFGGVLVCIYALMQYAWFDPIHGRYYHDGWDTNRVFSTLGNPNYLSGYLLLVLPLLSRWRRWQQALLWILFSFVLIFTQSVIAIILLLLYITWKILARYKIHSRIWIVLSLLILVSICSYLFLPHDKILSIAARFSLWHEALVIFIHHPLVFFLGNGPDTIIQYISSHGILFDSHYFMPSSIIDSFHNVIIDSVFFFGFPLVLLSVISLRKRWHYFNYESKEWILLFLLFFSMNIAISVHFLLLVFYIASENWKK